MEEEASEGVTEMKSGKGGGHGPVSPVPWQILRPAVPGVTRRSDQNKWIEVNETGIYINLPGECRSDEQMVKVAQ